MCFFQTENKLTKNFMSATTFCFRDHVSNLNDSYCFLKFNFFKTYFVTTYSVLKK